MRHKLPSEFLAGALFEALTLPSTQGDNSISSTPVVGELIVINLQSVRLQSESLGLFSDKLSILGVGQDGSYAEV